MKTKDYGDEDVRFCVAPTSYGGHVGDRVAVWYKAKDGITAHMSVEEAEAFALRILKATRSVRKASKC